MLKDFNCNPVIGRFDYAKLDKTFKEISEKFILAVEQEDYNSKEFLLMNKHMEHLLWKIKNPDSFYFPRCGVMDTTLNITLEGDILLCHNSDIVLGNINDFDAAYEEFEKYLNRRVKCNGCSARPICDSYSCVLEDEAMKERSCKAQSIIFRHFFSALRYLEENVKLKGE
jgi:radical SAM protein with 4Fe4S-binding SPASM domain